MITTVHPLASGELSGGVRWSIERGTIDAVVLRFSGPHGAVLGSARFGGSTAEVTVELDAEILTALQTATKTARQRLAETSPDTTVGLVNLTRRDPGERDAYMDGYAAGLRWAADLADQEDLGTIAVLLREHLDALAMFRGSVAEWSGPR